MWWKIRGHISKYFCIKKQGYNRRKVVENSWSYFYVFLHKKARV